MSWLALAAVVWDVLLVGFAVGLVLGCVLTCWLDLVSHRHVVRWLRGKGPAWRKAWRAQARG